MSKLFLKGKASKYGDVKPSLQIESSKTRKTFPYGIKEFHTAKEPKLDIVFVHGLFGDREKTWTDKASGTLWPRELLPSILPRARILSFGYDAYVADWTSVVSTSRIANHSKRLLNALSTWRENTDTSNLPILFVAHSLGGIVCKDALQESQNPSEEHLGMIVECTRGIIFMGVPHAGSDFAKWGGVLARSVGLIKQTNVDILRVLRDDSETLARISSDFGKMMRLRKEKKSHVPKITCFYEELPMPGIGEVVSKHSAILPEYTHIGIHGDHKEMTRFTQPSDPGFIAVSGELRRWAKELGVLHVPDDLYEDHNRSEAYIGIPFERDRSFVGRQDTIEYIDNSFGNSARVALAGLGGIGKTQIAIEYCYHFYEQHPDGMVFWIDASHTTAFDNAYEGIARKHNISGWGDLTADKNIMVKEWLSDKNQGWWLIVIDDVGSGSALFDGTQPKAETIEVPRVLHLPRSPKGLVLVTTRNQTVAERLTDRTPIIVPALSEIEAQRLLASKLPPDDRGSEADRAMLLDSLEYLPLAIGQAAAAIRGPRMTVALYHEQLTSNSSEAKNLLGWSYFDPRRDASLPSTVLNIYERSFDEVKAQNKHAAGLLLLIACLSHQAIPQRLFYDDNANKPSTEMIQTLGVLSSYFFISLEWDGETFTMPRLLHLCLQHWIQTREHQPGYESMVLDLLAKRFPEDSHNDRRYCTTLLPHCIELFGKINKGALRDKSLRCYAQLQYNVAKYLFQQTSNIRAASYHASKALESQKALLVKSHGDILRCFTLVALVWNEAGIYHKAVSAHRELLDTWRLLPEGSVRDSNHCMVNLAVALANIGKLDEAEELSQKAQRSLETLVERETGDVSASLGVMEILGRINEFRGDDSQAGVFSERCVDLASRELGDHHPKTAYILFNLARVMQKRDTYQEAYEILRRAYLISTENFAAGHPLATAILRQWASTAYQLGLIDEAKELADQSLLSSLTNPEDELATRFKVVQMLLDLSKQRDRAEDLLYYQNQFKQLRYEIDKWPSKKESSSRWTPHGTLASAFDG